MLTMATQTLASAERVTEDLIATGIALDLSKKCSSVNSSMLGDLIFVWDNVEFHEISYSKSEIDAFVDDRSEKDGLELIAHKRFALLGVRTDDAET
jgi:hypothetical protein